MSKFFEGVEEKSYIPPDYSDAIKAESEHPEEEDDDDDDFDDAVNDEDEGKIETLIDSQEQLNKKIMTTTPFGASAGSQSSGNSSWGSGGSWGSSGNNNSSPWGSGNSGTGGSNFWGSGNSGSGNTWGSGSNWGSGNGNTKDKTQIDRNKRIIFCDFLDCITETYQSQGQPGLIPRDIYDLKPRFEVWQKIQAFNPEKVYAIIPKNLIPSTNGSEGWMVMLEYFCCCLSSFLRVPYMNCQILAQSQIGQPKEELISSVVNNPNYQIPKDQAIYIGIYSGLYGQSNRDYLAANNVGIDYLDLGQLLNNMY